MSIGVPRITSRIVKGYISALKAMARVVAFAAVVAAISALITLPLWYWATSHRSSFTLVVLVVLAGFLLFFALKQIRSLVITLKTRGFSTFEIVLLPLKRVGKIVAALLLVYLSLIIFSAVSVAAGVISAVVSLILIGLLFFSTR